MRTLIIAIGMLAAAVELPADTITTLVASASGWYDESSAHFTGDWVAGWNGRTPDPLEFDEFRSYFVFNLAGLSGVIDSATLSLHISNYISHDLAETLGIFDVTTPIADLESGAFAFGDVGTGTLFGSAAVSLDSIGTRIDIDLNAAGLAALNAGQNDIAFGGAITTLAKALDCPITQPCQELVFGAGPGSHLTPYLIVGSKVPEPGSVYLLLTVLTGFTIIRFRRAHRPR
jgi:hypothetical protein